MSSKFFDSVLIIGLGLIGSSLARALKEYNLAEKVYGLDNEIENIKKCEKLMILDNGFDNLERFSNQFDLVIICSPLSTYKEIFKSLINSLKQIL